MGRSFFEKIQAYAQRLSPPVRAPEDSGDYWREHLANQLFCFGIVLGALVYLPSIVFVLMRQEWYLGALTTGVYVGLILLFASRRGTFRLRAWIIVLTLYVLGAGVYFALGPVSGGPVWLFAFPLLAGVFLGLRASILALAANTLTLALFGWLLYQQALPWTVPLQHSLGRWVVIASNFLFVDAVATGSAVFLVRALETSNSRLRHALADLRGETAQRAQAEHGLRVSEDRYLALTELATDYVVVVKDGKTVYRNPALIKALGYTVEDTGEGSFLGMVVPEDRQRVERYHRQRMKGGSAPETYEVDLLARDGRRLAVEVRPTQIELEDGPATLAVMRDITERQRQQLAFNESEERYRILVEESFDGIYVHQGERITFANQKLHQMLGYGAGELHGLPHWQLYHEDSQETVRERSWARLQGDEVISRYQVTLQQRNGEPLPAELVAKVVHSEGLPGIQVMVRDITERLQAERERDQMEARLRQSQKMEAVGTLAGGIAHDFNNILAAILGYAELGLDVAHRGGNNAGDLTQIIASAERARRLVRQILTFSRRVESDLKPMDLNREVRETLKVLERTLPKMVRITTGLAPEPCTVSADSSQIGVLLINLAKNGADAMDGSGELCIRTEYVNLRDMVCPTCELLISGRYVRLVVSDTGKGMERETVAKVFEPFFTTKEVGSGTGLGLAMVYGIVKNHNGHVVVESWPGRGTTMSIYLPALAAAATQPQEDPVSAVVSRGEGETVLVVDDEPSLRGLGRRILTGAGYRTLEAASGEDALAELARRNGGVDLVLLDLGMPGMGGMSCLGEIQARHPSVRVLIASGYGGGGQEQASLAAGAAGFVAKPYMSADLLQKVHDVLKG